MARRKLLLSNFQARNWGSLVCFHSRLHTKASIQEAPQWLMSFPPQLHWARLGIPTWARVQCRCILRHSKEVWEFCWNYLLCIGVHLFYYILLGTCNIGCSGKSRQDPFLWSGSDFWKRCLQLLGYCLQKRNSNNLSLKYILLFSTALLLGFPKVTE